MEDVKRWEWKDKIKTFSEFQKGEWVRYVDYEKLKAAYDELMEMYSEYLDKKWEG